MGFVSLEAFHSRKLRPGEALSVFVHELKKLLDQAMPGLDATARDQLLLHQFLGGIPSTVSRQLRATGETKMLATTVKRARLLSTLDETGTNQSAAVTPAAGEFEVLEDQVAALTEQVAVLAASRDFASAVDRRDTSAIAHSDQALPEHGGASPADN